MNGEQNTALGAAFNVCFSKRTLRLSNLLNG